MPRTIRDYPFNGDPNEIFQSISGYLASEGYTYKVFQGENVFQKGEGWTTGPTFFKITFFPNVIRLEAWMKYAVLPGTYAGEIDLDSFVGIAVKGPLKERYRYIENMILNYGVQPQYQQPQYQQPQQYLNVQSQQSIAVFCTNCGARLEQGQNFCISCGASVL